MGWCTANGFPAMPRSCAEAMNNFLEVDRVTYKIALIVYFLEQAVLAGAILLHEFVFSQRRKTTDS